MNYYLWIDSKEHGPYTLEQIQQSIDRGDITPQHTARTEESSNWETLEQIAPLGNRTPKTSTRPAFAAPSDADLQARQRVRAHLASVRANSCYPVLRSLIEVCFALSLIWVIGGAAVFWFGDMQDSEGFSLIRTLALFGVGILLVVVLIAARQSAFLLIDIADTLLHEHSKN